MKSFQNQYDYLERVFKLFLRYYDDVDFVNELIPIYKQDISYYITTYESQRLIDLYVLSFVSIYHMFKLRTFDTLEVSLFDGSIESYQYYHQYNHKRVLLRNQKEKILFIRLIQRYLEANDIKNYVFDDNYTKLYKIIM